MRRQYRPWLGTVEMSTYLGNPRRGDFKPIEDVPRSNRQPSLTGGVRLVVNGRELIDVSQWTDTDWLWPLFTQMIEVFNSGGSYATCLFPDAPVRFTIGAQQSSMVVLAYEGHERRRAVADKHVFFEAFCRAGLDYSDHVERLGRQSTVDRAPLVECLDGLSDDEPWPAVLQGCLGRHPDAIVAEAKARESLGVARLGW